MAREIIVVPEGDFEFGTGFDDDGKLLIAWRIPSAIDGADVILTFNLADFVTVADQMRGIADKLVDLHARD